MSDGLYLDNDVIFKACAYGAAARLVELCTFEKIPPAILGLAKFTLRSKISRSKLLVETSTASANLDMVLAEVRLLEPTPEEINTAADLEAEASLANLSLDAGESQIVAMLLSRNGLAFVTGDKRAAKAASVILPLLREKLVCLEQILQAVLAADGLNPLREAVCRERFLDRAVANCFQCSSSEVDVSSVIGGLDSYIRALRSETNEILVASFADLVSEVS